MPSTVIWKSSSTKGNQFFCNGMLIGTTRYTYGFLMDEIKIYMNSILKYRFSETNHAIWFLRKCIPIISLFLSTLFNGRYSFFEDNEKIGYAKEKWLKPIETFIIRDDFYHLSAHKNEIFSLEKNGKQIALYRKPPIEMLKVQPNTYCIEYSAEIEIEIVELFCLLVDLLFFTHYNGKTVLKVIVPYDPHPEYALWHPDE